MPYFNNPWPDAIPVNIDKLFELLDKYYPFTGDYEGHSWGDSAKQYNNELDAYVLKAPRDWYLGVRYGESDYEYFSYPHLPKDVIEKELLETRPADCDRVEEAVAIGMKWAKILQLKRSRSHPDRYEMTTGDKTALGVYWTLIRMVDEDKL